MKYYYPVFRLAATFGLSMYLGKLTTTHESLIASLIVLTVLFLNMFYQVIYDLKKNN